MHPHYLAQPERVATQGAYVHPPSKITLPESVAGFQRGRILRYDAHGLDVSDQILVFLRRAIQVTLFVNEPGDLRVGPKLRA